MRLNESFTREIDRRQIRAEISKKLKVAKVALDSLGSERETPEQQRRLLLDIVIKFQDTTRRALSASYGSRNEFNDPVLRLTARVVQRNASFSCNMATFGHEYAYAKEEDLVKDLAAIDDEFDIFTDSATVMRDSSPRKTISSRKVMFPGKNALEEILSPKVEILAPRSKDIVRYLATEYQQSRGFEIGTFNQSLLATLMSKQTEKWVTLSKGYTSDTIVIVHKFICAALRAACPNEGICSAILTLLDDKLRERYGKAHDTVEFLLKTEREGTPMTQNHYLNENLQKW